MNNKCPKCKEKDKELFPCPVLPKQWYHGAGEVVWLCRDCIVLLEKQFPLETVLSVIGCTERFQKFLTYQSYSQ
ncbi:MAG: hypothetical protein UR70_C0007G0016 [Candidatus Nomurabacteria bacterium GW2011_GWB1_35_20]|uniref:Uncharacterized protein n=3 Tax=Candidatus Nomuraibacteriota TaxID=1752729 RepID=A0A0G0DV44_9BACT|nr:MAG: hypothetical protein UR70_C0007G0016 [Candidatus Nomurabacteria bacterium GW2011_GWB1_35_20]KKP75603.1 MAG: hypothetical protein UR72_C0004G0061 [Parcubacteria group bacterium GW2011_GWC1_35_21]KKP78334.1 MAG: hypothetical protein UR77_C0004G0049 [Candidatus Nomurabacteria bacterium GW2011_GWC2_35_35]KKP88679.1 MAG: hypothetical protein UR92_C0001G0058 [Candidatus Nomurabacteria bacterium GW2011_GWA2_35_80]KKP98444.1 MAG: hypothetical protein US05_C0004G0075 [Candidatus Nomurabacteria b